MVTHVLLPVTVLLRRAYAAERIWAALTSRAEGAGHRRIGASLGVPAATVRGWLRRAADRLEVIWNWFLRVAVAAGVDVQIPDGSGCPWRDVLAAVQAATAAIRFRFGAVGLGGAVTPGGWWSRAVAGGCWHRDGRHHAVEAAQHESPLPLRAMIGDPRQGACPATVSGRPSIGEENQGCRWRSTSAASGRRRSGYSGIS
ncbi:hypothetical protein I553_6169 [Mycobacterium xenopi 4042]|uniref:Uncharacterized protein n=1 Tax=Mycobacterium xenopi 4042 TaxID=1299334 RepID=X8BEQ5_MYCXE|nr:hypothetical protein I553_6169 [Mycobacterium xenopi 4042]